MTASPTTLLPSSVQVRIYRVVGSKVCICRVLGINVRIYRVVGSKVCIYRVLGIKVRIYRVIGIKGMPMQLKMSLVNV